jgi:hypothetical protein
MLTKTIQIPKLVFDTSKLKIGQKVKYFERWTTYNVDWEDGFITGVNEIECIIKDVNEEILTLVELNEHTGFIEEREVIYRNVYRIKADDKNIELMKEE